MKLQMPKATTKKPYSAPRFVEYGSIAAITNAVGMTSTMRDRPGGGNNKTR